MEAEEDAYEVHSQQIKRIKQIDIADISLICSIGCEESLILLVSQRFNRVQERGFSGRVEANENAYEGYSQQIKRIKQIDIADASLICSIGCEVSSSYSPTPNPWFWVPDTGDWCLESGY